MTIRELEALVAEYEAKAVQFGKRAGVTYADASVSCGGPPAPQWYAWIGGWFHDGSALWAESRPKARTPAAALRAAYSAYCKEVRDDA